MNKLHIAPEAKLDLQDVKKYFVLGLANPAATANTIQQIFKAMKQMEHHAQLGAPLSRIVGFETPYRFGVNGSVIVFYFGRGSDIYITRLLYGQRDYAKILFRNLPEK